MLYSFVIVLILVTGATTRSVSLPLPLRECQAARTQALLDLSQREDLNGLYASVCEPSGVMTFMRSPHES